MNFLAGSAGLGSMVTVLVLCICIFLFVLTDIGLVISLHRQNRKLAHKPEENALSDNDSKE